MIDYKTEDYKEVATKLDIVFDTLRDDYAFQIIKEGGKVKTIVGPQDEEAAKQMGMTGYTLPEKSSKLIDEKSAVYKLTWRQPNAKKLKEIATMVEDNAIKPMVYFIYSLKDGIDAYEYLASERAEGKAIISLSLN